MCMNVVCIQTGTASSLLATLCYKHQAAMLHLFISSFGLVLVEMALNSTRLLSHRGLESDTSIGAYASNRTVACLYEWVEVETARSYYSSIIGSLLMCLDWMQRCRVLRWRSLLAAVAPFCIGVHKRMWSRKRASDGPISYSRTGTFGKMLVRAWSCCEEHYVQLSRFLCCALSCRLWSGERIPLMPIRKSLKLLETLTSVGGQWHMP